LKDGTKLSSDPNSKEKSNFWTYSFFVNPSETKGFQKSIFILFQHVNLVEINCTEAEFARLRRELGQDGFVLEEIQRCQPEAVL